MVYKLKKKKRKETPSVSFSDAVGFLRDSTVRG